jgi:hypothetical protein
MLSLNTRFPLHFRKATCRPAAFDALNLTAKYPRMDHGRPELDWALNRQRPRRGRNRPGSGLALLDHQIFAGLRIGQALLAVGGLWAGISKNPAPRRRRMAARCGLAAILRDARAEPALLRMRVQDHGVGALTMTAAGPRVLLSSLMISSKSSSRRDFQSASLSGSTA